MYDRNPNALEFVKMLNDANPNHREETRTEQSMTEQSGNRHERRKAAALARRKNKQGEEK